MSKTGLNKKTGKYGEDYACKYLEKLGYVILEKNYRYSRMAEIDIIAKDGSTIVFAEVKTRTSLHYGHPFEAVNHTKLLNIYKAGLSYLKNTTESYNRYRIDVISVITTTDLKKPQIEHLKDISLN